MDIEDAYDHVLRRLGDAKKHHFPMVMKLLYPILASLQTKTHKARVVETLGYQLCFIPHEDVEAFVSYFQFLLQPFVSNDYYKVLNALCAMNLNMHSMEKFTKSLLVLSMIKDARILVFVLEQFNRSWKVMCDGRWRKQTLDELLNDILLFLQKTQKGNLIRHILAKKRRKKYPFP